MRTRRGFSYPKLITTTASAAASTTAASSSTTTSKTLCFRKRRAVNGTDLVGSFAGEHSGGKCPVDYKRLRCSYYNKSEKVDTCRRKRSKVSPEQFNSSGEGPDFFEDLPDDIVVCILAKLSASASCSADLLNVLITCKRLNGLALNSFVLAKASPKMFEIKAEKWSESAHKFLKLSSDSGNVDASYCLGMIRFYCLNNRGSGASLMAKAASKSHAQALYSLAVIQFNGSGGTKNDKDLRAGVALCARAAFLGHVDALRELGHCLQDGYGVRQNIAEGRRFLVQANARELATSLTCQSWISSIDCTNQITINKNNNNNSNNNTSINLGCPLLSDFGCNVPAPEAHPANKFLTSWFSSHVIGPGLRLCSHAGCGRPESRNHEFRRCSVCGAVNYCSRACQALDWKIRHKVECCPVPMFGVVEVGGEINEMEVDEDDGGER